LIYHEWATNDVGVLLDDFSGGRTQEEIEIQYTADGSVGKLVWSQIDIHPIAIQQEHAVGSDSAGSARGVLQFQIKRMRPCCRKHGRENVCVYMCVCVCALGGACEYHKD